MLYQDLKLLPNLISLARIALIVPIALLYPSDQPEIKWAVFILLLLAYVSDYLDGTVARWLKQQSRLGLILDPLADKLWTLVMIFLLARYRDLPVWIGVIIIGRDVVIMAMNGWLIRHTGKVMPSDEFGRKYMAVLGLMIILLTMQVPYAIWLAYAIVSFAPITAVRYLVQISQFARMAAPGKVNGGQAAFKE